VQTQLPIAFLSTSFDKVQARWSTIEKECYAIWYALKKWEHHLRDVHFTIYTDHKNLRYLNNNSAKVVRWKLAIQEYDFVVRHIDGAKNVVPDALSRLCVNESEVEHGERIDADEEVMIPPHESAFLRVLADTLPEACPSCFDQTLCAMTTRQSAGTLQPRSWAPCARVRRKRPREPAEVSADESSPTVSSPSALDDTVPPTQPLVGSSTSLPVQESSSSALAESASTERGGREEPILSKTARKRRKLAQRTAVTKDMANPVLLEQARVEPPPALQDVQIPEDKKAILESVHGSLTGHMGCDATLARLRADHRTWPDMDLHVRKFIRECATCQKLRLITLAIRAAPYTLAARHPWERLCIDTIGPLTKTVHGYEHILVVIDSFSRFVELYPLRTVKAEEAAERLCEHVGRYGTPMQIQSDKGTQFDNDVVTLLYKALRIDQVHGTPYSKEENGIVERANKEIMRHVRAFICDDKIVQNWFKYLPMVQRIMNGQPHSVLKVSPAEIIFGASTLVDYRLFNSLPADPTGSAFYESS